VLSIITYIPGQHLVAPWHQRGSCWRGVWRRFGAGSPGPGPGWVWVTVKDLEDHWAEREYVIKANLARRQLNTAPRAELSLKLLEIERERAKKRQQLSGQLYGRGKAPASQEEFLLQWVRSLQEQAALEGAEKDRLNSDEPITCSQAQAGRSQEMVAKQVGIGKDTLQRTEAIQRAAAE
jgi:hypothetical protein